MCNTSLGSTRMAIQSQRSLPHEECTPHRLSSVQRIRRSPSGESSQSHSAQRVSCDSAHIQQHPQQVLVIPFSRSLSEHKRRQEMVSTQRCSIKNPIRTRSTQTSLLYVIYFFVFLSLSYINKNICIASSGERNKRETKDSPANNEIEDTILRRIASDDCGCFFTASYAADYCETEINRGFRSLAWNITLFRYVHTQTNVQIQIHSHIVCLQYWLHNLR